MRYVVTLVALLIAVPALAGATPLEPWFKTPGGGAYCGVSDGDWRCVRPADGMWLELTNVFESDPGGVEAGQGREAAYRTFAKPGIRTLAFDRQFATSDAAVVTCRSLRAGVTCKHYSGLSFHLGRTTGSRIFYDIPGYRPTVRPIFRRARGVWCGIGLDTLEPTQTSVLCWRPSDGLLLSIDDSARRGSHDRNEHLLAYRPPGFTPLGADVRYSWYCRSIDEHRCARPRSGGPTFTCTNHTARLTCQNRRGRGFWVNSQAFGVF